jgi:hypothetical protein
VSDADAFDDLPELVIGTTHLLPFVPDSSGGGVGTGASAGSSEESVKMTLGKGKTKGDGSIVHAEWAAGERRARWEKAEMAKWRIEGIGDYPAPAPAPAP